MKPKILYLLVFLPVLASAAPDPKDVNVVNTPDVNVTLTPYTENVPGEEVNTAVAICYFDVPAGKILQVEKVSGFTRLGNVLFITVQVPTEILLVPAISVTGTAFSYEASGPVYATNTNVFTDGGGDTRDFRVVLSTDAAGTITGTRCAVVGQLYDES